MGTTALPAERIAELARGNEDELLAELRADLLPPTIEAIRTALQPRCQLCGKGAQRWAVRNVLELAKLVGAQPQVLLAVFQQFGVRDQQELGALVASGRRMEQLRSGDINASAMADDFVEGLKLLFARNPELREGAMARLSSGAVEIEHENGNTNGNGAHE